MQRAMAARAKNTFLAAFANPCAVRSALTRDPHEIRAHLPGPVRLYPAKPTNKKPSCAIV